MITDRIGRHEVLLPINHKITIFEKRIAKLRKMEKIRIKIPTKEMKNFLAVIGLLQQTITWYKIRHTGGQAHYYSRTGTLKQRHVKLD